MTFFVGRILWLLLAFGYSLVKGKEKSWEAWVENRVVAIRKVVDREK